jgi:hypothetical protein
VDVSNNVTHLLHINHQQGESRWAVASRYTFLLQHGLPWLLNVTSNLLVQYALEYEVSCQPCKARWRAGIVYWYTAEASNVHRSTA